MAVERIDYEDSAAFEKDLMSSDSPEVQLAKGFSAPQPTYSGEVEEDYSTDELVSDESFDEQFVEPEQPSGEPEQPSSLLDEARQVFFSLPENERNAWAEQLPADMQNAIVQQAAYEAAELRTQQSRDSLLQQVDSHIEYRQERAQMEAAQHQQYIDESDAILNQVVDDVKRELHTSVANEEIVGLARSAFQDLQAQGIELSEQESVQLVRNAAEYARTVSLAHRVLGRPPEGRSSWAELSDGRWVK